MSVEIKQIWYNSKKNDIDRFIYTFLKLFNNDENLQYLSFTNIPFSIDMIKNWLKDGKQSGVEYYVALGDNENIVGILTIQFNTVEIFEILSVVVDNRYRNIGVGNLLLKKVIEKAKEKGFKSVDIAVFADNRSMLSLVIKNYFKPVKIEYRKRFDGEDIVYLKKYLK